MSDNQQVTRDPNYEGRLAPFIIRSDVPERWHDTPISSLIASHNFGEAIEAKGHPQLAIVTCIDYRLVVKVPGSFAYVLRSAGGRPSGSEFTLAYALSKGVKHMVLLGHNDCGMTKVPEHKDPMIEALAEQGWGRETAEEYVSRNANQHMISDEIDTLRVEYLRLRKLFRKLEVAPLFIMLETGKLSMPHWYRQMLACGEVDRPVEANSLISDDEILTKL